MAKPPKGGLVRGLINQYMGVAPSTFQVVYSSFQVDDLDGGVLIRSAEVAK